MITLPFVCEVTVLSNIRCSLYAFSFFVKMDGKELFNGGSHFPLAPFARTRDFASSLSFLPHSFSTFHILSNRTVIALSAALVFASTVYIQLCVLIVPVPFYCSKCPYFLLFLVSTFGTT
jgi:hypothetical protein